MSISSNYIAYHPISPGIMGSREGGYVESRMAGIELLAIIFYVFYIAFLIQKSPENGWLFMFMASLPWILLGIVLLSI